MPRRRARAPWLGIEMPRRRARAPRLGIKVPWRCGGAPWLEIEIPWRCARARSRSRKCRGSVAVHLGWKSKCPGAVPVHGRVQENVVALWRCTLVGNRNALAPCPCTLAGNRNALALCPCTLAGNQNSLAPCPCTMAGNRNALALCQCTMGARRNGSGFHHRVPPGTHGCGHAGAVLSASRAPFPRHGSMLTGPGHDYLHFPARSRPGDAAEVGVFAAGRTPIPAFGPGLDCRLRGFAAAGGGPVSAVRCAGDLCACDLQQRGSVGGMTIYADSR